MRSDPPVAGAAAAPALDERKAVELELPARRRFHPTGRLVAGGLASRAQLDVDQLNDLRLAVDALLLQPPAEGTVEIRMAESAGELALEAGPFSPQDLDLTALARVLRALVDDFSVQESERGEWIAVRVSRRPRARGGR